jgi:hypothetical protein
MAEQPRLRSNLGLRLNTIFLRTGLGIVSRKPALTYDVVSFAGKHPLQFLSLFTCRSLTLHIQHVGS